MKPLLRALLIGAALWLGAATAVSADAPSAEPPHAAAATANQILVMLRLPPEHFRPNVSYGGGYGSASGMAARHRIADRLARQHGLTVVNGWPMPVLGVDCYVMAVPASQSPAEVAAALSRDPQVAWSEPMQTYHGQAESEAAPPNDPLFALQPAAKTWRLADLHRIATGRNVKVAIVDSRVDVHHPDLVDQILLSRDFLPDHPGDAESHGTAVAGIIAASADNQLGVAGVAPRARLMALRACWQAPTDTLCDTLSLARALSFAIENHAQVINLSLSGPPAQLLERLVDVARARGALVVGAVDPKVAQGGFPASHAGVIAVASDGGVSTTRGAYFAPGRDVPTTQPHARWSLVNGSSFAAAHVTGLLALVREKDPHAMDPVHIVVARGGREIDACATLLQASGPCAECSCPSLSRLPVVGGR